ncbi:MAG TPA: type II toxin-antitoxin system prevent-host-death family antitoxin [Hyphomonadaceae bacterium]|nr:type II toxin-antitoxin system prevent-host-death family antitoxin [Hyphomonadaceae bacterium]
MTTHSVAEEKNSLSELIDRALRGEGVIVTRRGTPVVEVRAIRPARPSLAAADIEWLETHRIVPRPGFESPSQSLSALRDEADA